MIFKINNHYYSEGHIMTTKPIILSLFCIVNIVNGMNPDFNMEELIQCALNPRIKLEENRDCINAGYLTTTYVNPTHISSGDLTEKSKTGLANYFFKINKNFNPSKKYSDPYNRNNGTSQMREKIDLAIGDHHKALESSKNHITNDLSKKFNDIAEEHNGLKLHKDFDKILEKFPSTSRFTKQEKEIIKKYTKSWPHPWYANRYITIRLRAINTHWKNGQDECTLSDSEIDKITEKIQQFE
jgi:hypothetical protein